MRWRWLASGFALAAVAAAPALAAAAAAEPVEGRARLLGGGTGAGSWECALTEHGAQSPASSLATRACRASTFALASGWLALPLLGGLAAPCFTPLRRRLSYAVCTCFSVVRALTSACRDAASCLTTCAMAFGCERLAEGTDWPVNAGWLAELASEGWLAEPLLPTVLFTGSDILIRPHLGESCNRTTSGASRSRQTQTS